jgi:16S rRNA (adenine1518-N6/adenine1519-N6)-dimethyltransferase
MVARRRGSDRVAEELPGRAATEKLLERNGIELRRALGQNFVVDPNTIRRIVALAGVGRGDRIVEVGAGIGSLTLGLAATGAEVVAVEIDRRLIPLLTEAVGHLGVAVVEADALRLDFETLLSPGDRPWQLVANLPYNIATALVLQVLEDAPSIERLIIMVQAEVAERLVAAPGSRAYGQVSVRVGYFATGAILSRVGPGVFLPRPKVDSCLVELTRRREPAVAPSEASYDEIVAIVRTAFSVRRKMLRRSLAGTIDAATFEAAGVAPQERPERVAIEAWGRLAGWHHRPHGTHGTHSTLPPS